MAKFSFDPTVKADCDTALAVIAMFQGDVSAPSAVSTEPAAAAATAETGAEPSADGDDPNTPDIHGMVWSDEIHSNPPTLNKDGSWRGKRGRGDELAAAIAAHKAQAANAAGAAMANAPAQAATGMPGAPAQAATGGMPGMPAMPASPAPNTPPAPVTYDDVSSRFVAMMESGEIGNYEAVYSDLSVGYDDLQTNQTSLQRLTGYMDSLSAGNDHATAVQAGLARA